jgi:hypothetical protein
MWRMTKAVIVSWIVGVVCGVGMVLVMQNAGQAPPASNASVRSEPAPQATAIVPASPDGNGR